MKNLGTVDRLFRVILAEVCIILAFFWVAEEWQIPLYLIAAVMLLQAVTRTCGLYTMLGWNSCESIQRKEKNLKAIFVIVMILLAVAGCYASAILTKNIFLDDLSTVNDAYSLALQHSGEGDGENAKKEFGALESAFGVFQEKYTNYRPLTVKFDGNFTAQMSNISEAISVSKEDILQGDLSRGHEELEKAKPAIQKMLER